MENILIQNIRPGQMQIEVIGDYSNYVNIEQLAANFAALPGTIYHDYGNPSAAIKQAYRVLILSFNMVTVRSLFKSIVKYLLRYKAHFIKQGKNVKHFTTTANPAA